MKKYIINYSFDTKDNRYVAVCPNFLGFILYCDTLDEMKRTSLKVLKNYTRNESIDGKQVFFVEQTQELELGL